MQMDMGRKWKHDSVTWESVISDTWGQNYMLKLSVKQQQILYLAI